MIAEVLFEFGEKKDCRLILDNQFPQEIKGTIADSNKNVAYDFVVESKRMGLDIGREQLINISGYLKSIKDYVHSVSRQLTPKEILKIQKIVTSRHKFCK